MKKTLLALIALIGATTFTGNALAANQNRGLQSNRNICDPQDLNVGDPSSPAVVTTCDWAKWSEGNDPDAQFTLHGQKPLVAAECSYVGSDEIDKIIGKKHASFRRFQPKMDKASDGSYKSEFKFCIQYHRDKSSDDNQNILVYLNTDNPSRNDKLSCKFYQPEKNICPFSTR